MNRIVSVSRRAAVLLAVAASAAPALAADAPNASAICPGLHAQLQDTLVGAVQSAGVAGRATVRLRVEGRQVVEAVALSAPPAYDRALRRALRGLRCEVAEGQSTTVSFDIRFIDPWGREERNGVLVAVAPAEAPR